MLNKEKKIIVLTGASRGIGHATVKKFQENDWRVITCSRQSFDDRCPWPGGEENHIQVDLSDKKSLKSAIGKIKTLINGNLHALVNNAGISPKNRKGERLDVFATEINTWQKVFDVNFFSTISIANGLKNELANTKGAIVNITSIAGSRVHPFAGAAYATSKAALKALTREMANDFGKYGVRVNAVAPGEIETKMLSKGTDKILRNIPLKRLGQPNEIADIIYFLCSVKSSYVSGTEIEINGGQHV